MFELILLWARTFFGIIFAVAAVSALYEFAGWFGVFVVPILMVAVIIFFIKAFGKDE